MAKLNLKTRQTYLKELGFYTGEVDGKEGSLTKKAYKELQNKYFTRKKDLDGKYGNDTDKLLRSAYNCRDLKHFKLTEFKCKCKGLCTGYPAELSRDLVLNLDKLRSHYGKSVTIRSGERCTKHNNSKEVGGSIGSKHTKGKAADIYFKPDCSTKNGRLEVVKYWTGTLNQYHAYCNGYRVRGGKVSYPNTPKMGTSVHTEVK